MIGYIYLLCSKKFGWYKIGKSKTPEVRVRDLGILLPFQVEVIGVWESENYHALELKLHDYYAENRLNGEWFSFRPWQVKNVIEDMQKFARMETLAGFTNAARDCADGKELRVKMRDFIPDDERERLAKECQAARKLRKSLRPKCPTCGHGIITKEERETLKRISAERTGGTEPTLKTGMPIH